MVAVTPKISKLKIGGVGRRLCASLIDDRDEQVHHICICGSDSK